MTAALEQPAAHLQLNPGRLGETQESSQLEYKDARGYRAGLTFRHFRMRFG